MVCLEDTSFRDARAHVRGDLGVCMEPLLLVSRDPLPASPGGSRPPPSGLSVFRSDAHSSSLLSDSPFLGHHLSGPGGLGPGGTIGPPSHTGLLNYIYVDRALNLFNSFVGLGRGVSGLMEMPILSPFMLCLEVLASTTWTTTW